jgi:SAM-dependent methyltransferase
MRYMTNDCCSVCQNTSGNKTIVAREMLFGYRDEFEYLECARCGYLRIKEIPENLSRFYPSEYHPTPPADTPETGVRRFLKHQRAAYCLYGRNVIGKLLVQKYGAPSSIIFGQPEHYAWLKKCEVDFASEILEIGCSAGHLLVSLGDDGFSRLTGVDPLINEPLQYENGVKILKTDIYKLDGQFDLIMLHHTFEHMPEHLKVLKQLHRLLKARRYVVIRIPIAASFAYRKYGAHWAQLDPPRHLSLHTVRSLHILAASAGFVVAGVTFDSTDFQFWASEQYLLDIPLRDAHSYMINPQNSIFSKGQIRGFRRAALDLNMRNDGDSACFYLYKP